MAEPSVRVVGLRKSYAGGVVAVEDVSFDVGRGEMFGLIGPDGAGKTTTLRTVLGLLAPDGGAVTTCGLEPLRQRRTLSQRIGYLPQRFSLYGDLSADDEFAVGDPRQKRHRHDGVVEFACAFHGINLD